MIKEEDLVFVISLPRSGSTLVQRVLSTHSKIYQKGELWLFLVFGYLRRKEGLKSRYGQSLYATVLNRIIEESNDGEENYAQAVRMFYLNMVSPLMPEGKTILVDKTPRYHLVLNELSQTFPNAKYIILYRNPLAVFGSYLNAMRKNKLRRTDAFSIDLTEGPKNIAEFSENFKGKILSLSYEAFVESPQESLDEISSFLQIDAFDSEMANMVLPESGGVGDSWGSKKFKKITNRTDSWKDFLDTRRRKKIAWQYLDRTDERYLRQGGYDLEKLKSQLKNHSATEIRLSEYFYALEEGAICFAKRIFYKLFKY